MRKIEFCNCKKYEPMFPHSDWNYTCKNCDHEKIYHPLMGLCWMTQCDHVSEKDLDPAEMGLFP